MKQTMSDDGDHLRLCTPLPFGLPSVKCTGVEGATDPARDVNENVHIAINSWALYADQLEVLPPRLEHL